MTYTANTQHTPGPWSIAMDDGAYPKAIIEALDGDGYESTIAVVYKFDDNLESNAHLIAASPELLEACEALLDHASAQFSPDATEAINKALAAIAKAKGA